MNVPVNAESTDTVPVPQLIKGPDVKKTSTPPPATAVPFCVPIGCVIRFCTVALNEKMFVPLLNAKLLVARKT